MSKRGIFTAATWATATFGLILAVGYPLSLDAVDPSGVPVDQIAVPKIVSNGIELWATFDSPATRPTAMFFNIGDKPTLQVHLENQGKSPASLTYTVIVNESRPASPMSRSLPIPQTIYSQDNSVTLAPGEQKTFTITTDKALPQVGNMSVVLRAGNSTIIPITAMVIDPNNPAWGRAPINTSPALNVIYPGQPVNLNVSAAPSPSTQPAIINNTGSGSLSFNQ